MWMYKGESFSDDMIKDNIGFVYKIYNVSSGKSYIGKKFFKKSKTYQKNLKKKKKLVESDWQTYTGSNDMLNEDIKNGNMIKKEILHLCKSKGMLSYMETKEIFERDCLLKDTYYNSWVSVRVRRSHLKLK